MEDKTPQPEKTPELIAFELSVIKNGIRQNRNRLLAETDKYLLPDFPITLNNLTELKEYRQLLRDFMQQEDIFNLELPKKPSFIS